MAKRKSKQIQSPPSLPKRTLRPGTLVDIVIPVLNQFPLLEKCLKSIPNACADIPYQVFIYDNGSDKDKADAFYKDVDAVVMRSTSNIGYPAACNLASRRGNAPFVMMVNSDIEFFPNAVKYAVMDMQSDPTLGVVGMKLLFPEGTPSGPANTIQHVGLESNIRGEFFHQFIGWNPNNPKVVVKRDCLAVTGAVLLTRRELWNRLGGYDQMFGLGYYEDVDYCLKVRSINLNVIVEQHALAYHWTNATSRNEKVPINIQTNLNLFMARWAGRYPWTEYIYD